MGSGAHIRSWDDGWQEAAIGPAPHHVAVRHDLDDSEARRPATGVTGTNLNFFTDIHVGTSCFVTTWLE